MVGWVFEGPGSPAGLDLLLCSQAALSNAFPNPLTRHPVQAAWYDQA